MNFTNITHNFPDQQRIGQNATKSSSWAHRRSKSADKFSIFLWTIPLLCILFYMSCVTNAKACDGNADLDPENNCLPRFLDSEQLSEDEPGGVSSSPTCQVYGIGTTSNPYRICDYYSLSQIGRRYPANAVYALDRDIDASSTCGGDCSRPSGQGGRRIGLFDNPFSGTFYGEGYEIRDYFLNYEGEDSVGLFGYVKDGKIVNLNLVNFRIRGGDSVGSLVGYFEKSEQDSDSGIYNVHARNIVVRGDGDHVGGLVGYNQGGAMSAVSLEKLVSEPEEDQDPGDTDEETESDEEEVSQAAGSQVMGNGQYVGGLIGYSDKGYIAGSEIGSEVEVRANVGNVGGALGCGKDVILQEVESKAKVGGLLGDDAQKVNNIGGLVGRIEKGTIRGTPENSSYVVLSYVLEGDRNVGGLVGYSQGGNISYAYIGIDKDSGASIKGDERVGGLVGFQEGGAIDHSYAQVNVQVETEAGGGLVGYLIPLMVTVTVQNEDGEDEEELQPQGGTLSRVSASGSVIGEEADSIGGLAGYSEGEISTAFALGLVRGKTKVGGLVGHLNNASLLNTYAGDGSNQSTVSAIGSGEDIGGLVGRVDGEQVFVKNSYAANVVNGGSASNVAGLIGYLSPSAGIHQSLMVAAVNGGSEYVGSIVGKCAVNEQAEDDQPRTAASNLVKIYYHNTGSGHAFGLPEDGNKRDNCYLAQRGYQPSKDVYLRTLSYLRDGLYEHARSSRTLGWSDNLWGDLGQTGSYPCLEDIPGQLAECSGDSVAPPASVPQIEGLASTESESYSGTFTLNWQAPVQEAGQDAGLTYILQRRLGPSGSAQWEEFKELSSPTWVADMSSEYPGVSGEDRPGCNLESRDYYCGHHYRVIACYDYFCGNESYWNNAPQVTVEVKKLNIPQNLQLVGSYARENYEGRFELSWGLVTGATTYQLQEKIDEGSWGSDPIINANVSEASLEGKDYGKSYSYRVSACHGSTCSPYSDEISLNVRLAVPQDLTRGDTGVSELGLSYGGNYEIVWSQAAGAEYYELEETNVPSADDTDWASVSLDDNTSRRKSFDKRPIGEYYYRVRACVRTGDDKYCGPWADPSNRNCDRSGTCDTRHISVPKLSTPELEAPENAPSRSYMVSWAEVTGAARYELQEATNGGSWEDVTLESPSSLSQSFSGKEYGDEYSYRGRACNRENCGDWGTLGSGAVEVSLAVPDLVSVSTSRSANGDFTLSWSRVPSANHYRLKEGTASGDGVVTWEELGARETMTSFAFQAKVGGYSYQYRVKACAASGYCGDWSNVSSAVAVDLPSLSLLSALTGEINGNYKIVWDVSASLPSLHGGYSAYTYELEQRHGESGNWVSAPAGFSPTEDNQRTASFSGQKGPATYFHRIKLCNQDRSCNYSDEVSVEVGLSRPNLSVTGTSSSDDGRYELSQSGGYGLSWSLPTAHSYAVGYEIQENIAIVYSPSVSEASWGSLPPDEGGIVASTFFAFEDKEGGYYYSYRVRACVTDFGCSDWSDASIIGVSMPNYSLRYEAGLQSGDYKVVLTSSSSPSVPPGGYDAYTYDLEQRRGESGRWVSAPASLDNQQTPPSASFTSQRGPATYYHRLRFCNKGGDNCLYSNELEISVSLDRPVLSLTGRSVIIDGENYTLSWSLPSENSFMSAISYRLYENGTSIVNGSSLSFVARSRSVGPYTYKVKACTDISCTGYSNSISMKVVPSGGCIAYYTLNPGHLNWINARLEGRDRPTFSDATALCQVSSLDLSCSSCDDVINSLPNGVFAGLTNLRNLNLRNNNLAELSPEDLASLPDTVEVSVCLPGDLASGNAASCPIVIRSYTDLLEIHDNAGGLGKYYKLLSNIDASSSCGEDEDCDNPAGSGWEPLGTSSSQFTGSFDGNNKTISKLYINRPSTDHVGLFGYTSSGAEIRDIGLVDVNISGDDFVGGLVGISRGSISNSYVTGEVSGKSNIGVLVGYSYGSIRNSYATGTATGSRHYVGGFSGNNNGSIINSYATGLVIGDTNLSDAVGGFIGVNDSTGSITNSYAISSVTGHNGVGGLVGNNRNSISNSYAVGSVSGSSYVGRLVGNNSAGTISGTNYFESGISSVGSGSCSSSTCRSKGRVWLFDTLNEQSNLDWDSSIWGGLGFSGVLPCLKRGASSCSGYSPPSAPSNFRSSPSDPESGESYTLYWDAVTGAKSYRICEGLSCEVVGQTTTSKTYSHTVSCRNYDCSPINYTYTVSACAFSSGGACSIRPATASVSIEPPPLSDDVALSELTLSSGTLSPEFWRSTTSYTTSVANSVSQVSVSAVARDISASVSGTGVKSLSVGSNTITVRVTAENGRTQRTYTVSVTRASPPPPPPSPPSSYCYSGGSGGKDNPRWTRCYDSTPHSTSGGGKDNPPRSNCHWVGGSGKDNPRRRRCH